MDLIMSSSSAHFGRPDWAYSGTSTGFPPEDPKLLVVEKNLHSFRQPYDGRNHTHRRYIRVRCDGDDVWVRYDISESPQMCAEGQLTPSQMDAAQIVTYTRWVLFESFVRDYPRARVPYSTDFYNMAWTTLPRTNKKVTAPSDEDDLEAFGNTTMREVKEDAWNGDEFDKRVDVDLLLASHPDTVLVKAKLLREWRKECSEH